MKTNYDVVIHDSVGMAYRGDEQKGLGGSEFSTIRLAKALARRGLDVLVQNNLPAGAEWRFGNVDFRSNRERALEVEAKTLILQRYSRIPLNVGFDKMIVQLHDMPDKEPVEYLDTFFNRWPKTTQIVCNSEWQHSLYPAWWGGTVIPCLLPEGVEAAIPHRPGHYVYASAAMKGLERTLEAWELLTTLLPEEAKPHLHVISSWDANQLGRYRILNSSISVYGQLTHEELSRLISSAEGVFYVNRFPETFCVTAAMAERLGTRNHILCENGFGALQEVLTDTTFLTDNDAKFARDFIDNFGKPYTKPESFNDFSVEAGVKRWLELLQ